MTTGQSVTRAHTDQSTHGDAGGGNARLPGPRSAPAHCFGGSDAATQRRSDEVADGFSSPSSLRASVAPSLPPDLSVSLDLPAAYTDDYCYVELVGEMASGCTQTLGFYVVGTRSAQIARDVLMARFALASDRLRELPRCLPALDAVAGGLLADLEAETYPRAVRS